MNERAVTQIVSKIVCALPMALVFYEEPIISKFAEGVISFLGVGAAKIVKDFQDAVTKAGMEIIELDANIRFI